MTQQPEPSRIVEDTAIRILDELAVEGGRASRAHLFDVCQVKLWGHVVNVAARRAGYSGHDETEVARHGKDQLFVEAMNLLLEREQIVVWDEEGKVIALHPTHRDDYIPGTNLWRSQRRVVLDELRTQLLHFRDGKLIGDQSFEATLRKAGVLYAQQLRRGQLAGAAREEAIADMLTLADVLFDPTRLASLLGIDESEIRAAAARRLQPAPAVTPTRKAIRRKAQSPATDTPSESSDEPSESEEHASELAESASELTRRASESDGFTALDIRRGRTARNWSQAELARRLGVHHSTLSGWELSRHGIDPINETRIQALFAKHPVLNGQA